MKLTFGDLLEFLVAGCFIAAGAIKGGSFVALLVAGAVGFYLAQSHAKTPLPKTNVRLGLKRLKWAYQRQVKRELSYRERRIRKLGG
jgi:hypothetical protein